MGKPSSSKLSTSFANDRIKIPPPYFTVADNQPIQRRLRWFIIPRFWNMSADSSWFVKFRKKLAMS